jgi:hypothetical protein
METGRPGGAGTVWVVRKMLELEFECIREEFDARAIRVRHLVHAQSDCGRAVESDRDGGLPQRPWQLAAWILHLRRESVWRALHERRNDRYNDLDGVRVQIFRLPDQAHSVTIERDVH